MAPPITRPVNIATDFDALTFESLDLSLFDLFSASARKGAPVIEGRTFRDCRIQGPGVILVSGGVNFDDTNFGDPGGDVRNLVMRAVGPRAMGVIPVRNCSFIGCEFYAVGFTGPETFIEQILSLHDA